MGEDASGNDNKPEDDRKSSDSCTKKRKPDEDLDESAKKSKPDHD